MGKMAAKEVLLIADLNPHSLYEFESDYSVFINMAAGRKCQFCGCKRHVMIFDYQESTYHRPYQLRFLCKQHYDMLKLKSAMSGYQVLNSEIICSKFQIQ